MEAHYAEVRRLTLFRPWLPAAGWPYRFEEANSFYDGGAADVAATHASALWALNYQWWWAEHHMSGINFHTGDKVAARDENKPCRYATFWTTANGYNIHPIAYAEKMFSLGSRGKIISWNLSVPATSVYFRAYAVHGDDNAIYVTLINFSHGDMATNCSVQISARTPVPVPHWRHAEEMWHELVPGGTGIHVLAGH